MERRKTQHDVFYQRAEGPLGSTSVLLHAQLEIAIRRLSLNMKDDDRTQDQIRESGWKCFVNYQVLWRCEGLLLLLLCITNFSFSPMDLVYSVLSLTGALKESV